jgi:hypothetical protein
MVWTSIAGAVGRSLKTVFGAAIRGGMV